MKVSCCAWLGYVALGGMAMLVIERSNVLQPRPAAASASEPSAVVADAPVPTELAAIEVAHAEVALKLAKLDLQKMVDLQNRVRGSITASQFDRVEGLVRVADETLQMLKQGKNSRADMNLLRAKEALRTAEHVWKTAKQVKTAANAISDIELERLRTMVDLERLGVAKAEAVARTDSPLDDLGLELDQMRDEMSRLRYRFEAMTARR